VSQASSDEKIGERTRDLLRALSEFADMVAISAPVSVLSRQVDEMEKIFSEIDQLAGSRLRDNEIWSIVGDPAQLMRLYEVLQHRQAQKRVSE
jgi:hypothetical protein